MNRKLKCAHESFFYDKKVQKILLKWTKKTGIPGHEVYATACLVHLFLKRSHFNGILNSKGSFSDDRVYWETLAKSFSSNILLFCELAVAIERYYRNLAAADHIFDAATMEHFPFLYSVKHRSGKLPRKLLSVVVFESFGIRVSEKAALQILYREVARRKKIDREWNSMIRASKKCRNTYDERIDGHFADPDRTPKNPTHFRTPADARSILKERFKFPQHRLDVINKLIEQTLASRQKPKNGA